MRKAIHLGIVALALAMLAFSTGAAYAQGQPSHYAAELVAATSPVRIGAVHIVDTENQTTSVTITLDSYQQVVYTASLNSGHCGGAGAVRYALVAVKGGTSVTTLQASYSSVTAPDWHIALSQSGSDTSSSPCADSKDGVNSPTNGMPGVEGPIFMPPPGVLPISGGNDQAQVVYALIALALGALSVGVTLRRSRVS